MENFPLRDESEDEVLTREMFSDAVNRYLELSYTIDDMCDRLAVSVPVVKRYINGENMPQPGTARLFYAELIEMARRKMEE